MNLYWEPLNTFKKLFSIIEGRIKKGISSAFLLLGENESGKNVIIDKLKSSLLEKGLIKCAFDFNLDHYVRTDRFEKDFINSLRYQYDNYMQKKGIDSTQVDVFFGKEISDKYSIDFIIKIIKNIIKKTSNESNVDSKKEIYNPDVLFILRNFAIVRGDKQAEKILRDFFINLSFSLIDESKGMIFLIEADTNKWLHDIVKYGNGGKLDSRLFGSKITNEANLSSPEMLSILLNEISLVNKINLDGILADFSGKKDLSYEKVINHLVNMGLI